MPGLYVDTSALGRVLLGEPDAGLIRARLAQYDPWWSSALLIVELRRLARREGAEELGEQLLSTVSTRRLDSSSQLHKRDAINAVLTYDQQLQAGCTHHGLPIEAPALPTASA